jgi:hypothetical protein
MFLRLAPVFLSVAPTFAPALAQSSAQGGSPAALQTQIMAASLFRFLAYVEWPPEALPSGAPFVIGVIGADGIADELTAVVAARTVDDRAVRVRRLNPGEPRDGLHALFIGAAGTGLLHRRGKRPPVLIVTDSEGALDHGSMINFRIVDDRVRFEVALEPLEEAGLKVSSRMLGVALHVRKIPPR